MIRSMTEGNITKHLLLYSVPLLMGNLLQQLYHTADSVIVGRFNGKEALAAVGAAGPIMNILIFFIVGISLGTSVLMASFFGGGKLKTLKEELATALVSGGIFTGILMVLSFAGSGLFIRLTQTPEDIEQMATLYLASVSLGLPFTYLYNIFSSALRSIGESRVPFYVLVAATVTNIVLDILLIGSFHMGVAGAALATISSQAMSAFASFVYIQARVPMLRLTFGDLKINAGLLKDTIDYSLVAGVQQTVLYLGRILVQSGVNTLGIDAVAAFNAASITDNYILAPGDSLAAALTTYIAQNNGAKKRARIIAGVKRMLVIMFCYIAFATIVIFTHAGVFIGLFLEKAETNALELGVKYLTLMACFYILTTICQTFQGFFRGVGELKITLIATFIQIPIRVAGTYALLGVLGIQAVSVGVGIGWAVMSVYELWSYRGWKRRTAGQCEG